MANEIKVVGSLTYAKGISRAALAGSVFVDQVGDHYIQSIQNVGAIEEELAKGDIGVIGYVAFRNNSDDQAVEIGASTGEYSIKLEPGEFAGPMRWDSSAVFAVSYPGVCELEYLLIEA
jgi:hypothetical protein